MPTYEYTREDGSSFEIIQKMSDDPLKKCPTTGQKVKRSIGAGAGLIFKGSGFYETDYVKQTKSEGSGASEPDGAKSSVSKDESSSKKSPSAEKKSKSDD